MKSSLYDSATGSWYSSGRGGPGSANRRISSAKPPSADGAGGGLLALMSAGAYGFVMASNYNGRALAAEVLVDGAKAALVRRRQRVEELWAGEKIPASLR